VPVEAAGNGEAVNGGEQAASDDTQINTNGSEAPVMPEPSAFPEPSSQAE
jgi:hypothetical protein